MFDHSNFIQDTPDEMKFLQFQVDRIREEGGPQTPSQIQKVLTFLTIFFSQILEVHSIS